MRAFWLFILALIFAATAGVLISQDPGYALFSYGAWTTEMPLWLAIFLILCLFIAFYGLLRTIHTLRSTSKNMRRWHKNYQQRNARLQSARGLLALAEGRWKQAERQLSNSAMHSDHPHVNYVYAAQAAQALSATDRRDHYLELAVKHGLKTTVNVRLTHAALELKQGRFDESGVSLEKLYQDEPKNVEVLRLLSEVYKNRQDFASLLELLPALAKESVFDTQTFETLEQKTYESLLPVYAQQGLEALRHFWQAMPHTLQKNAKMLQHYADYLMKAESYTEAEAILLALLKTKSSAQS
jgi:HemY protein